MREHPDPPTRRRTAARGGVYIWTMLCCCISVVAYAADPPARAPEGEPEFRITHEVIASGGVTQAKTACFNVAATIAQPVTGTSQGGPFVVTAGFLADYQSDSIFRSSFESCPP